MNHKNGTLTDKDYTLKYIAMMQESMVVNKDIWLDLIKKGTFTLYCYCPKGKFCHRYILADLLIKFCKLNNIKAVYKGEL